MATISMAKTQAEFLEIFIKEYDRKPNQKEYNNWKTYVNLSKARIKSASKNRMKKKDNAVRDWEAADDLKKLKLMAKVINYQLERDFVNADPYLDEIMRNIKSDVHFSRLFSYLIGFEKAQAIAKQEEVELKEVKNPKTFLDGFVRRGWRRATAGLAAFTLEDQLNYLASPNAVRL